MKKNRKCVMKNRKAGPEDLNIIIDIFMNAINTMNSNNI